MQIAFIAMIFFGTAETNPACFSKCRKSCLKEPGFNRGK